MRSVTIGNVRSVGGRTRQEGGQRSVHAGIRPRVERAYFAGLLAGLLSACLLAASGCQRTDGASDQDQSSSDESHATQTGGAPPPEAADDSDTLLVDITQESGLQFVHDVDNSTDYFMPKSIGSGAGLIDFNDDGRLDVYLLQNAGPESGITNRLFRQEADGRFVDVSEGSGLDVAGFGMGVAAGDVNNDGAVDIFITEYGRIRLFENRTQGDTPRFVDVTKQAGLESPFWGVSTCFFDYDRDGWLDLIVVNYSNYDPARWCADGSGRQEFCGPDAFVGRRALLFHNLGSRKNENGEQGTSIRFEDVTIAAGFAERPAPGLGVFCADFDGDRWPDVFVTNDAKPNHLWINQHDGTFREEALERGVGYNGMGQCEADMGVAIGDVNGDEYFDVFVTHLTSETHTLWLQEPRGFFEDRTALAKLGAMEWRGTGFGTVMVDLDNSGSLDLAVVNGRVVRSADPPPPAPDLDPFWAPYAERDQLMLNDGNGRFRDVSEKNGAFSDIAYVSRGLACGDLNNDGAIDLLVSSIDGPARLFRNTPTEGNHWLMVRAIDPALRRDAYGAEIHIRIGDRRLMRWINPGYSFLCSNDSRAHFGLGNTDRVDAIEVIWPDGTAETFPGVRADQMILLEHGEGQPIE